MSTESIPDDHLRDYLLGRLAEEDRTAVEDRLLTDHQFLRVVEQARLGLLLDHAAGRLDAETAAVAARLTEAGTDAKREWLIIRAASDPSVLPKPLVEPMRRSFVDLWAPVFALASLAVAISLGILYFYSARRERELASRESQLLRRIEQSEQDAKAEQRTLAAGIIRYGLRSNDGITRSSGDEESPLQIPSTATVVELRFPAPPGRQSGFSGLLRRSDDPAEVWSGTAFRVDQKTIGFLVPAALFETGRYRLIIRSGQIGVAESNFSVRSQRGL